MTLRYALRLADGSDAGEVELPDTGVQPGDEIRAAGNVTMLVTAVVPVALIEEFVDRSLCGLLEVDASPDP